MASSSSSKRLHLAVKKFAEDNQALPVEKLVTRFLRQNEKLINEWTLSLVTRIFRAELRSIPDARQGTLFFFVRNLNQRLKIPGWQKSITPNCKKATVLKAADACNRAQTPRQSKKEKRLRAIAAIMNDDETIAECQERVAAASSNAESRSASL